MSINAQTIMQEDLRFLREKDRRFGEPIGAGSYGFVVKYEDGSSEQKVVKILDPAYISCKFQGNNPKTHSALISFDNKERELAQKIGYTKCPWLMPMLDGPKKLLYNQRELSFLVMPRYKTIESLSLQANKAQQIVDILCDCCNALAVLHSVPQEVDGRKNGADAMVHCDIKPDNIFYNDGEYILGDYSITQKLTDLEKRSISIASTDNPYAEPGPLGIASDIYALGWVLFYWMNGKVHPTMEQVRKRKTNDLSMPSSWGDHPELWTVFLKLTAPDRESRVPSAKAAKSILAFAQRTHEQRLSEARTKGSYADGSLDGSLITGGVAAILALIQYFSKRKSKFEDRDGLLHGMINKKVDFLGGTFKGRWEHGYPAEGTFVTPSRIEHTGQWIIRQDYEAPFMRTGISSFSGLSLVQHKDSCAFQGDCLITWDFGPWFKCDIDATHFKNCVMIFSDGKSMQGDFSICTKHISNGNFNGILTEDRNGKVCGVAQLDIGPDIHIECEVKHNDIGMGILFLGDDVEVDHTDPTYIYALQLLINMVNAGSHFTGRWSEDGFPESGTYVFGNRKLKTGDFSYVIDHPYPLCTYTGMLGDDGLPWGIGTIVDRNGNVIHGEFSKGELVKEIS